MFNSAFAQEVAIELTKENVLIHGITNPLNVVIKNVDCNSIYLTSKDAILDNNGCKSSIIPNSEKKELTLSIYKISKNDTVFIKNKVFRVKLMKPLPALAGFSDGEIKIENLKHLSFKSLRAYSEYVCTEFQITSCKILFLRNDKPIGISDNYDNKFSIKTKELIKKTEIGDKIYFLDIKCKVLDNIVELDPMKFQII